MGRAYGIDLRARVVEAIEGGLSHRQAAERFCIAVSTAGNWHRLWRSLKGCADAARAFAANGNRSGAVEVLLDVEIKANELKQLVEVVSFVSRRTESD